MLNQAFGEVVIGIDAAVTQKGPMLAIEVNACKVALGKQNFFLVA